MTLPAGIGAYTERPRDTGRARARSRELAYLGPGRDRKFIVARTRGRTLDRLLLIALTDSRMNREYVDNRGDHLETRVSVHSAAVRLAVSADSAAKKPAVR